MHDLAEVRLRDSVTSLKVPASSRLPSKVRVSLTVTRSSRGTHLLSSLRFVIPYCLGLAVTLSCPQASLAADPCTPPVSFAGAQVDHKLKASDYGLLGNSFQQSHRLGCAVGAFRKGLEMDPQSASLHYSLGIALYAESKREAAKTELERSLLLDTRLARAELALGVIEHDLGDRSKALDHWQRALLIDPDLVIAIDWIAKARIEAGQYTAAADFLRTAPDDQELVLDFMLAASKAGLSEDAIKRAQEAEVAHPEWSRIDAALATVLVQRNRYEEALAVLKKAREKRPGDQDFDLLYLRVLVLSQNEDTAIPLGRELLEKHPKDFDLLYLNGLSERQRGDYGAAAGHLQKALALDPKHYDVRYNLGFALLKLHRPEEAHEELAQAILLDPTAPEAHFQMAACLRVLNRAPEATKELALYQQLMQARAARDRVIALSADAKQKLDGGDVSAAISLYLHATEDAPEDYQAFYNLGMALDRANDAKGERIALERAVQLRPEFAAAMNQLGFLASRANDTATAEAWFRKAIKSAPQFAEAESNLGTLLAGTGHETEAEQHFRSALAANPRYTDAWINLAATLASMSQFEGARQAAKNALKIDPANIDAVQLLSALPATGEARP